MVKRTENFTLEPLIMTGHGHHYSQKKKRIETYFHQISKETGSMINDWFQACVSTEQRRTGVKSWQVADGSEELSVIDWHLSQPLQRIHPLCASTGLQSCFLQSLGHRLQLGPGLPELLQTPAYPLQVRLDHGLEGKQHRGYCWLLQIANSNNFLLCAQLKPFRRQ